MAYHENCLVASAYGMVFGPFQGIYGVVLVELFGLDRMTGAFGISYFFQGVGSSIGPVLSGWAAQLDNFDLIFTAGGIFFVGSSLFTLVAYVSYKNQRRQGSDVIVVKL